MKALITSLLVLSSTSYSAVILNDAVLVPGGMFGDQYVLELTESIRLRGYGLFAVGFRQSEMDPFLFELRPYGIAEIMAIYLAPAGTVMNAEFVSGNIPLVTNAASGPFVGTVTIPENTSRYLAYWDQSGAGRPASAADNYGWVQITNLPTGLVATSGATAVGGGIIVGTTTQIPELSSFLLASLAGVGVFARRH